MDIKKEYLKLLIKGVPKTFTTVDWESAPLMSFARFQRFVVDAVPPNLLLAYNDDGEVINRLLTDGTYSAKDIKAVDFSEYFRNSFDSSDRGVPTAKLLYIFNIGEEEVKDYSFSDKKLLGIVRSNLQQGNCVIMVSNIFTITMFKRNYPLTSEKITTAQQIKK